MASDPDRYLYVHSAEDILLQTLHWYRLGGGTSECSWLWLSWNGSERLSVTTRLPHGLISSAGSRPQELLQEGQEVRSVSLKKKNSPDLLALL